MTEVTYRPPELRLSIVQGVTFHRELAIAYDRTTGEPFNFSGWTATLDLVDEAGAVVVSFAESGEAGVIGLSSFGGSNINLDSSFTATLPATVEVAGVVHAPLRGHLIYLSPESVPYEGARVTAEIVRSAL